MKNKTFQCMRLGNSARVSYTRPLKISQLTKRFFLFLPYCLFVYIRKINKQFSGNSNSTKP